GQLGHLPDESWGQIVHDEVPEILEALRRLRSPRPGEPSDDGEVGGFGVALGLEVVSGPGPLCGGHQPALRSPTAGAGAGGACDRSWIVRASPGPTPGVSSSSSTAAAPTRVRDPNRRSRAFFRLAP